MEDKTMKKTYTTPEIQVIMIQQQGNLQVVQVVGELLTLVVTLATLLRVVQARLKVQGRRRYDLVAGRNTDVQSRLGRAAVQVAVVGVNR